MMIYRVCFWNDTKGHEGLLEAHDLQRVHLTREDHRNTIRTLFFYSATEGVYAEHISATVGVFPEGHPEAFRALPISYEMHSDARNYPRIYDDLYVNGELIRRMTIAD